ncbi:hypothetical protein P4H71_03310 [Paenibacillus kribbensis]|uniref:hypothetical protein n=1 Tax=Paenibacillus kribbensis TaxID=172713 RepID=UPI002DBFE084|nr:hypothetical protein [Paenibacillus kribbensis]MEC0233381.1 hypothetical protein [Paenibacillus kribbensis]
MKVKKTLLLLSIPLLLAFAIIVYIALPWLLIIIGTQLEPNPPRPEITYGKFPFRLEYEINGQRKVIQDTLICEYDGIGSNEGQGKYRKWKDLLAGGDRELPLLEVNGRTEISYYPGIAEYYMGDLDRTEEYQQTVSDSIIIEQGGIIIKKDGRVFENDGKTINTQFSNSNELLDKYHIKLISWDSTPPIKGNFPETK